MHRRAIVANWDGPRVWVGIGALGTAGLGMVYFGDTPSTGRLVSLALLITGIVGLKLSK